MSEFDQPIPLASMEGQRRREQWMARLQANADLAKSAELAAYGQSEDRRVAQAGQAGIFGHATGQQMAASTRARPARVGEDYGGRDLIPLGGTVDPASYLCGPVPPQRDLTRVDQQGRQPGHSPLWDYMNGGRQ